MGKRSINHGGNAWNRLLNSSWDYFLFFSFLFFSHIKYYRHFVFLLSIITFRLLVLITYNVKCLLFISVFWNLVRELKLSCFDFTIAFKITILFYVHFQKLFFSNNLVHSLTMQLEQIEQHTHVESPKKRSFSSRNGLSLGWEASWSPPTESYFISRKERPHTLHALFHVSHRDDGKRRETRIVVVRKVVLEWSNLGTEKPKEPVAGHIGRGKEETEGNWPALSAHLTPSPARGG